MPIRARLHLRKMGGGAQSHLIECEDGGYYIVKYRSNPQHRRILPNEWIAAALLKYLGIASPETAIIEIPEQFIREFPEASIQLGTRVSHPEPGWHFGSKFPGDPARMAIYDFVPDQFLAQVHNLRDFVGVLAFDKWAGNSDGRQAIFFRARISQWLPGAEADPRKMGFIAYMIDHGYIFNGPHWEFISSPVQGLYPRRTVYNGVRSLDDFQPWLDQIVHFPERVIDEAVRQIPPQWITDEEDQLEKLLETLLRRRKMLPDLIADARLGRNNPFANWPG